MRVPRTTVFVRASLLLFGIGFSLGEGIAFLTFQGGLPGYVARNELGVVGRRHLLLDGFAAGALACVLGLLFSVLALRRREGVVAGLWHLARRFSPLGAAALVPILLAPGVWPSPDLVFMSLTLLGAWLLETGTRASLDSGPLFRGDGRKGRLSRAADSVAARFPRVLARLPLAAVAAIAVGYGIELAHASRIAFQRVKLPTETWVESRFLDQLVRGGSFWHPPPVVVGGRTLLHHPSAILALLAPVYAMFPGPETLLAAQAVFLAIGAVPLYLLARTGLGPLPSVVLAALYLAYPPVRGLGLDGFHALALSTPFLFVVAFALESRRPILCAAAAVVALLTHENAGLLVAALGAYWALTGRNREAGFSVALAGLAHLALMRGLVLPRLPPAGEARPSWAAPGALASLLTFLRATLGNPWHAFPRLDDSRELQVLASLLVPLALSPLRSAAVVLLAPPMLLTVFATPDRGATPFESHHVAEWLSLLFVATVMTLGASERTRRRALLVAIVFSTLACGLVYGAVPGRALP